MCELVPEPPTAALPIGQRQSDVRNAPLTPSAATSENTVALPEMKAVEIARIVAMRPVAVRYPVIREHVARPVLVGVLLCNRLLILCAVISAAAAPLPQYNNTTW